MYIVMFLAGVLIGALITFIAFKSAQKNTEKQAQLYFENIANKILKENSQEFSTLNQKELTGLLMPFREQIEKFEKRVEENIVNGAKQFTNLDTNIRHVLETGKTLSQETNKLSTTFRYSTKAQGRWGEFVLDRVLEMSGLRKNEEYFEQKTVDGKRPDVIVMLPENRCIIIDVKTTLTPYDDYLNAEDEIEKQAHLKTFKESIKSHISNLAKNGYSELESLSSPEYVLMFIPIESCYSLLFADDAQLWDLAWKNRIMPVSPSNLLATLKIINSFHIVNRQNQNAQEIASLAGRMIDKFKDLCRDIATIDTNLKQALTKLNGHGNIIKQIEKLEELGAKSPKEIKPEAAALIGGED